MPSKELIDGEWMKICSRKECDLAGQYQPVSNFGFQKKYKDGLSTRCKKCAKSYRIKNRLKIQKANKDRYYSKRKCILKRQKEYYERTREKRLETAKNYRRKPENIKKTKEYSKEYRKNKHNELLLKKKEYYQKNKQQILEKNRQYRKNPKVKKQINKRQRNRYSNDTCFRVRISVVNAINKAIKKTGGQKGGKTFEALSYTPQELKEHIENQFSEKMNWDNYGDYWHIDHIIPQAALPYESLEEESFQKCWALENLRPLEATENMSKGSLYEGERHTYTNNKETSNG